MFHCFQFPSGEKRFPNEILGVEYPITIENISLKTLEREYLLKACMETDKEKKWELLRYYYSIRFKREKFLGKIIDYEKAIESVEGTAVYVEYKTLTQLISYKDETIFEEYMKDFTEVNENNLKVRQSTYKQGLLLCLIADEYIVNWKSEFFNSSKFLSDFIEYKLEIEEVEREYKNNNLELIKEYIMNRDKEIDKVFNEFDRIKKSNVLENNFQIIGFDPMNIIKKNQEIRHKNFLKIKAKDKEKVINGPVKAIIGEDIFYVKKIEW